MAHSKPDPTQPWQQWRDATFGAYSGAVRDGAPYLDPLGLYRQWLDGLDGSRAAGESETAEAFDFSRQWTHTLTETWRQGMRLSESFARLGPRWVELAEALRTQMLAEPLPRDPLTLLTRFYAATTGPLTAMSRDLLSDDAYLQLSRRLLENYVTSEAIFRRACEDFFSRLQLSTSADSARIAALVVGLDDKVDRLDEAWEDATYGTGRDQGGSGADAAASADVRARLERVEEKLDQLIARLGAQADASSSPVS